MKFLAAFLLLPLALAGCSKGSDGDSQSGPVAAVAPPAGQSWSDVVVKTDQGYRMGNPNASVKLVEYGDRLCPACKAFATTGYEPLIKNYVTTGKVSFEFRDFLIHGAPVLALATLGQCGGTAPFFPILEQTYQDQDQFNQKAMAVPQSALAGMQGKTPAQIATFWAEQLGAIDWFKQRGLPEAQARQCLNDEAVLNHLADVTQQAGSDGTVSGTPTLIVNGQKVDGVTWKDVEAALKSAGA